MTQQVHKGGANTAVDIEDKIWLLLRNGTFHYKQSTLPSIFKLLNLFVVRLKKI